jgi:hypothetical protein
MHLPYRDPGNSSHQFPASTTAAGRASPAAILSARARKARSCARSCDRNQRTIAFAEAGLPRLSIQFRRASKLSYTWSHVFPPADQSIADESVSQALDTRLAAIRGHIIALASVVPDLANQFWRGRARVTADLGENDRVKALLLLAVFVGLGVSVEWLFRRATQRVRGHLDALPSETIKGRLHAAFDAFRRVWVPQTAVRSASPRRSKGWSAAPPVLTKCPSWNHLRE